MPVPNYINILAANCFMDFTGALISRGTLSVTAVDATGQSVPFHVGGGGIATVNEVTRPIVNGSITSALQLANPAASDISIGYTFVVVDLSTFQVSKFEAVAITADDIGNYDLSTLHAGTYAQAVPVAYVPGPAGTAGTVTVGTTTTLAAGASATVTNSGTASAAVLNFGIPQGAAGTGGGGGASNTVSAPLSLTGSNISLPAATDSVDGYLSHADHAIFAGKQAALGFTPLNPANNLSEVTPATARTNLGLAVVASSGAYSDLTGNPSIPAAQVNADWNAVTGVAVVLNKPTFSTVAVSGAYTDLTGKPAFATVASTGAYADLTGTPTIPTGTVTSVTSANANATVATGTSTPVITIVSAPKLTTARTINGVSFDGSANITVPAAASTLTGSTLATGVTTATGLTTVAGGTFGTAAFTSASAYDGAGAASTALASAQSYASNASNLSSGSVPVGQLPVMVGSGVSHAAGLVPDAGATAGTTRFLREDATWATPNSGYELHFSAGAATTLAASTTYILGGYGGASSNSAVAGYQTVLQSGTITSIEYGCYSHTAAVAITMALYNVGTSTAYSTAAATVTPSAIDTYATVVLTGLSIAVTAGDKLQFRFTTPSTAPGTSGPSARLFIK